MQSSRNFTLTVTFRSQVAPKLTVNLRCVSDFECDFDLCFKIKLLLRSDWLKRLACLADCHRLTRLASCSQHLNESSTVPSTARERERGSGRERGCLSERAFVVTWGILGLRSFVSQEINSKSNWIEFMLLFISPLTFILSFFVLCFNSFSSMRSLALCQGTCNCYRINLSAFQMLHSQCQ